jgi:acyl-CoA reductase-like NAD-dependent aldehyde dehydrogenase
MAATFFTDVDNAMMRACNENFGPVLSGHGS